MIGRHEIGKEGKELDMKQIAIRRSMALLLAVALVFTMSVSCTFAKTKSVKKCGDEYMTKKVAKKATKVKRGTTHLKYKGESGYVKFKAPKTKKYTITYSNMQFNGYSGHFYIMKPDKHGFINEVKCKTNGGKLSSFWVAPKGEGETSGAMKYRSLEKRYAKVKIKKGKSVYIYFWHNTYSGQSKAAKATLTIK